MKTPIARQFAGEWATTVSRAAESPAEIADVLHSSILASMLLMVQRFGLEPPAASALVEVSVQEAIKDFSRSVNEGVFGKGPSE